MPTVQVFVSSTWLDLQPERAAVGRVIHRTRETKFLGMEYFGSRSETTRQASLDEVDRSQLYVGIFAARYGSGITEAEYRRAQERGLPCLIYFKDDGAVPDDLREADPEQAAKLDALKQELRAAHTIADPFKTPDQLAALLATDLHRWLIDEFLTPKLEAALRGEVSRDVAQSLLEAIKDTGGFNRELLKRLEQAGYANVTGERGVAFSGRAEQVNISTGDTNIYNSPALSISARHQLRAPVGDFVGRKDEIDTLLLALRRGTSAAISGISGMGGIGKTELALYVADKLKDAYPDAQLLLDMRGTDEQPRDPADALAACVRAFVGLEQKLPDRLEDLTALYRDALSGKRVLILLDNARDAAQVRPLLPPAGSALLVTSREMVPLPGMTRLTLEQLQPAEARELLTSIARRVPADLADQICYLCGYLPLAVRAAASLLDITPDLAPADYVAQLTDERTRLQRIGVDPNIGLDVEASLGLSYQRLPPDAARVFRQLSVFPATFDAAAEEVICEDEGHRRLSDLLRHNLAIYDSDAARYRLHDLARLFAAARLGDAERDACQKRHAWYFRDVIQAARKFYRQGGEAIRRGLSLLDLEWKNIQAGQAWAAKQAGENDLAASLCSDYPQELLILRRHPREIIAWVEAGLAAARRLKDRTAEGSHLGNLGYLYNYLGEYRRAVEFNEAQLAITRELGDRQGEVNALGNLGIAFINLGEPQRAIRLYEELLIIAREINDRRGEGLTLINLGNVYARLAELGRAVQLYERALVIHRELGDRRAEGLALGNLGVAFINLGEPERAIEVLEQQLIITQEIGDRRGEGNAHFNIAVALDKLGDRAQALVRAEAALKILEQVEAPHTVKVRAKVAEWRAQG